MESRVLAENAVVEREVIVSTKIDMRAEGCGLRYCTLGACEFVDPETPGGQFVDHCAIHGTETDAAALWDWASGCDCGHVAD